jgi:hypothetical protein
MTLPLVIPDLIRDLAKPVNKSQYMEKPVLPVMASVHKATPEPKQPIQLPEPFRGHSAAAIVGVVALAVVVAVMFKVPGWELIPALL